MFVSEVNLSKVARYASQTEPDLVNMVGDFNSCKPLSRIVPMATAYVWAGALS